MSPRAGLRNGYCSLARTIGENTLKLFIWPGSCDRYWSVADMGCCTANVRFRWQSRSDASGSRCRLTTRSGHSGVELSAMYCSPLFKNGPRSRIPIFRCARSDGSLSARTNVIAGRPSICVCNTLNSALAKPFPRSVSATQTGPYM